MKLTALEIYRMCVKHIENGEYESVSSQIAEWRDGVRSNEIEACRRLLSARLALQSGNLDFDMDSILAISSNDPFLKAEARFVIGLGYYQTARFSEGYAHFAEAEKLYQQSQRMDRAIICGFNAFLGRTEAKGSNFSIDYQCLVDLQREVIESKHPAMLGVILRQKAYLLFDHGKFHASYLEVKKAIDVLELDGPHSDYQLAIIHAADCCINLGKLEEAKGFLEYIHGAVDDRVRFPLQSVQSRMSCQSLDLNEFATINPYWLRRYNAHNSDKTKTSSPSARTTLPMSLNASRPQGMEGKLIRELTLQAQSRSLLCEKLWPHSTQTPLLANRLYRLINRVNKRYGKIIGFNGQAYCISMKKV